MPKEQLNEAPQAQEHLEVAIAALEILGDHAASKTNFVDLHRVATDSRDETGHPVKGTEGLHIPFNEAVVALRGILETIPDTKAETASERIEGVQSRTSKQRQAHVHDRQKIKSYNEQQARNRRDNESPLDRARRNVK